MLLTFLSIFFFGYISKQSRNQFNSEINTNIQNTINNIDLSKIKEVLKLETIIERKDILNLYSGQDKQVEESNKSLMKSVIIVLLILWVGFIIYFIFNNNNEMKHIIKENILTFVMIGIVEFIFFKCIAWNFIPVEPDYLPTTFHNLLLNKLNV